MHSFFFNTIQGSQSEEVHELLRQHAADKFLSRAKKCELYRKAGKERAVKQHNCSTSPNVDSVFSATAQSILQFNHDKPKSNNSKARSDDMKFLISTLPEGDPKRDK